MKNQHLFRIILLGICFALGLGVPVVSSYAEGGIMVMPIRIMFKDRDRSANVTLVNTNIEEANFKISTQAQKQKEDGGYEIQKEAFDPAHDLAPMLVYSPRQVTLPGSDKQRIRLALRRPPDLADGEYRTHLLISNMGKNDPSGKRVPAGKLALDLGMNVGYSIPVILRQGTYDTTATIDDPKFLPAGPPNNLPQLSLTLKRSGKFSTIGKVNVFMSTGGQEEQIGTAGNVNIFPELDQRTISVVLTKNVTGQSVRVVYEGDGPDKGVTFDQKTYPIGGQ